MNDDDVWEIVARTAREEIVRQYRDNDRAKWPAGAHDYEEHQSPFLVAGAIRSALSAAGLVIVPRSVVPPGALMDADQAAFPCRRRSRRKTMGEAKAKRARLTALLGETRGDQFEEFLADLQTLNPQTPFEHDRVYFMRLFATAVVEGLNARSTEGDSAARCLEIFEEMAYVVGTQIGAQVLTLVRDDIPDQAEAAVFLANRMSAFFAKGMAVPLATFGRRPDQTAGTK